MAKLYNTSGRCPCSTRRSASSHFPRASQQTPPHQATCQYPMANCTTALYTKATVVSATSEVCHFTRWTTTSWKTIDNFCNDLYFVVLQLVCVESITRKRFEVWFLLPATSPLIKETRCHLRFTRRTILAFLLEMPERSAFLQSFDCRKQLFCSFPTKFQNNTGVLYYSKARPSQKKVKSLPHSKTDLKMAEKAQKMNRGSDALKDTVKRLKSMSIRQTKKGWCQELMGCQAKTEFKLFGRGDEQVGHALEDSSCCCRLFCAPVHAFDMEVQVSKRFSDGHFIGHLGNKSLH